MNWIEDLLNPNFPFLRNALFSALLLSIPVGVTGTVIVARRLSYLVAAVSHATLGGIGLGLYLKEHWGWAFPGPSGGAALAACASALLMGWIGDRFREREDALTGVIWTAFMATGLLLIHNTPGYMDPMTYLFGDILMVDGGLLQWAFAAAVLIPALFGIFYDPINAYCFDSEFAQLRGIPIPCVYSALLVASALTVVLAVALVGIVLAIALITTPACIALRYSRSLAQMALISVLTATAINLTGLLLAYALDWPAGPTIAVTAALAYLISMTHKSA